MPWWVIAVISFSGGTIFGAILMGLMAASRRDDD